MSVTAEEIKAATARAAELRAAQSESLDLVKRMFAERQDLLDQASAMRDTITDLLPMVKEQFTAAEIGEACGTTANAINTLLQAGREARGEVKKSAKGKKAAADKEEVPA